MLKHFWMLLIFGMFAFQIVSLNHFYNIVYTHLGNAIRPFCQQHQNQIWFHRFQTGIPKKESRYKFLWVAKTLVTFCPNFTVKLSVRSPKRLLAPWVEAHHRPSFPAETNSEWKHLKGWMVGRRSFVFFGMPPQPCRCEPAVRFQEEKDLQSLRLTASGNA